MPHWNYRVVRRISGGEVVLAIHEAYYDAAGDEPAWITDEPVAVIGDDLRGTLDRLAEALQRPVIDYDKLVRGGSAGPKPSGSVKTERRPLDSGVGSAAPAKVVGAVETPEMPTGWRFLAAEFLEAAGHSLRMAPRRYFAPLVGAVCGAVEYTNAAFDEVPVGRRRAKLYARLLVSLRQHPSPDADYCRRLVAAILAYYGDLRAAPPLTGGWCKDLEAFGCPGNLPERPEEVIDAALAKQLGHRFAERYRHTMGELAKGDGP